MPWRDVGKLIDPSEDEEGKAISRVVAADSSKSESGLTEEEPLSGAPPSTVDASGTSTQGTTGDDAPSSDASAGSSVQDDSEDSVAYTAGSDEDDVEEAPLVTASETLLDHPDPTCNGETATSPMAVQTPSTTVEPSGSAAAAPRATACSLQITSLGSELVQFVQIHDVIPCDFNQDGIIDLIAINHRLSTAYGFVGIGNGLFEEGPTFDLPFRPAAAMPIGNPLENSVLMVSSEGTISLFRPLITVQPASSPVNTQMEICAIAGDAFSGTVAVLDHRARSADVYALRGDGLTPMGAFPISVHEDRSEWYERVLEWRPEHKQVPVLADARSSARIVDLNCDGIPDVVSVHQRQVVLRISRDGVPLAVEHAIAVGFEPISLRVADLTGNGMMDIIALSPSGVIDVLLLDAQGSATSSRQ